MQKVAAGRCGAIWRQCCRRRQACVDDDLLAGRLLHVLGEGVGDRPVRPPAGKFTTMVMGLVGRSFVHEHGGAATQIHARSSASCGHSSCAFLSSFAWR